MRSSRLVAGLPIIVALTACIGDGPRSGGVERYDSAGLAIVVSPQGGWAQRQAWRVEPTPALSVGGASGDPAHSFGAVAGAIRVGDHLIVADDQANALRAFDLEGRFVARIGGQEAGATTFGDLNRLQRCNGNQVYVEDRARHTIHVRDSLGAFVKEVRMLGLGGGSGLSALPHRVTCSPIGTGFLSVPTGGSDQMMQEGVVLRWYGDVRLMNEDGSSAVELGRYPTGEYFADETARRIVPHPFGRSLSFAVGPESIYLARGETFAIEVFERSSGRRTGLFRGPSGDPRTAEAALFEYLRADLSRPEEETRQMLARSGLPMPDALPAVSDLRLDHQGYIWAKRYTPPGESGERWGVFAPDGAFLGDVLIPYEAALTDIGDDWIVTVRWDTAGGPSVHVHPFSRGSDRLAAQRSAEP